MKTYHVSSNSHLRRKNITFCALQASQERVGFLVSRPEVLNIARDCGTSIDDEMLSTERREEKR
jgi:hypothetical protein